ncbi:hypothetical protein J6590_078007 [Homalodisca vitripennis]|nr:hypothetical protein J6590_078007 [Homalodisca vitripennis]
MFCTRGGSRLRSVTYWGQSIHAPRRLSRLLTAPQGVTYWGQSIHAPRRLSRLLTVQCYTGTEQCSVHVAASRLRRV